MSERCEICGSTAYGMNQLRCSNDWCPSRTREDRNKSARGIFVIASMGLLLGVLWGLSMALTDRWCARRGGHLEPVIGGRGGWVCVGATDD